MPPLAALILALVAASAAAQAPAVTDPQIVEFDPSPDHSATSGSQPKVTRYDLELYVIDGTTPVQVINLGKPAPQGDGKIRVNFTTLLNPWPAAGTVYEARVAAVGPEGVGRSTESNTFAFSSPCSSSISPTAVSVNGQASTGNVAVSGIAGCSWSATSARILDHDHLGSGGQRQRHGRILGRREPHDEPALRHAQHRRPDVHRHAERGLQLFDFSKRQLSLGEYGHRHRGGVNAVRVQLDGVELRVLDHDHVGSKWQRQRIGRLFGCGQHHDQLANGHVDDRWTRLHGHAGGCRLHLTCSLPSARRSAHRPAQRPSP